MTGQQPWSRLPATNGDDGADDDTLMARVAQGDERALRQVGQRHYAATWRLAKRLLTSEAEADDVAQEVLVRVWNHAARWTPGRAQLSTWLYTVTYRLCLDRLRGRRHAPLEAAMDVADPSEGAAETMERRSEQRRVRDALASLPEKQRAALVLFYYQEMPGPQASAVLGLNLRAYWSLLYRARGALERALIKGGKEIFERKGEP
ncbi:RNA polymerase sigma-70 factor (ECF subfamily) [Nitrospirillum amazonense]|uniref:RNA polymerase sigma factor n=1 Tax=Nitrospirillum amazonense TaxID=28077 RepID=A0A560FBZ8_9PROT|nr:sigma-70 family RNA polymerase sigma factor [Nitrospirillum amazonense]TWB19110.1 RNA polymerase sigma-70 factor (ECF subfamily) [Nitrospirillum amazonense]